MTEKPKKNALQKQTTNLYPKRNRILTKIPKFYIEKKNFFTVLFSFSILIVFIILGIFLPAQLLLHNNDGRQMSEQIISRDDVTLTDNEIAFNVASEFSRYEQMCLISGLWNSKIKTAPYSSSQKEKPAAVALAIKQIEPLYEHNLYPSSLAYTPNNYYCWNAQKYIATDATFYTYSASFWKITFTRFNHSEKHTILMMEDGTIIQASSEGILFTPQDSSTYVDLLTDVGGKPDVSAVYATKNLCLYPDHSYEYLPIISQSMITIVRPNMTNANTNKKEMYIIRQKQKGAQYQIALLPYSQ